MESDKLKVLFSEARKGGFNLKEYISRGDTAAVFTQAINQLLIAGAQPELPDAVTRLFSTVPLAGRRDINFPSIRGFVPDVVPELTEFNFISTDFTSVTVTPQKFGMRMGFSREMLDDNEVGLIGWRAREVGRMHRRLKVEECIKALSVFSTGPVTTTSIIGSTNKGLRYTTGGYANFLSATALPWENIIGLALRTLISQTYTVQGRTVRFPVRPNFILANPHYEMSIKKVLQASITVVGTGVGIDLATQGNNVAGSNIFTNAIPLLVFDPMVPTGQAFIGEAGRGTIICERDPLQVDEMENMAFDAQEMRSRERFIPAVIENRFICDVQL